MTIGTSRLIAGIAAAFALMTAATAGADSVQVGSSAWFWGNPLPQGNTLRSMSFAGGNGFAAGDFGTLLKTTDGGSTWTGLRSGTYTALDKVQAVDANTVVAGGGCVARLSTNGGASFSRIAFTNVESYCPQPLAALYFVSANTGFVALGDGSVISTSDGGQTFASKVAVPGTPATGGIGKVTDMFFASSTVGFATSSDGKLYRTLDGASSWAQVGAAGAGLNGITFGSATTGYAVGAGSSYLKTTDSGATWSQIPGVPGGQDIRAVRCASALLCAATTGPGNIIIRTDDGGTSFSTPSPSTAPIYAAAFNSTTQLAAGGADGTQVTSGDGGVTFAPVGTRLVGRFSAIRAGLQANTAFAPGADGALGKTTDGGKTWTRANVTTSEDVLDVAFATATNGYALDTSGGLFLTTNGAATWKTLDPGTKNGNSLFSPNAATVLLIGAKGVRRSVNSGTSFTSVKGKAVAGKRLGGSDSAGKAIVVFGAKDIAVSSNAGKSFKKIKKPGKAKKIDALDFVTAKLGFVLGSDGRLWRTKNGGKKWTEVVGLGTNRARDVAFSSAKNGYLVIDRFGDATNDGGWLLRTTDGGATWHPQFVVSSEIAVNGIAAPGGTTDYLLGGSSALLFSNSGGDSGTASTLTIKTSKKKLKKATTIKVTGKLSGAQGNERVAVLYRKPGKSTWTRKMATVSASGSFTTSWKVAKGFNTFVAQWAGDFRAKGDGSPVLKVSAKKK